MNILFVCSRNQWRSPTAEAIYKNQHGLNVKSARTSRSARIKLSAKLIQWADIIFAMEREHKEKMHTEFSAESENKRIVVLEIPDEYKFMDAGLIEEIKLQVDGFLNKSE